MKNQKPPICTGCNKNNAIFQKGIWCYCAECQHKMREEANLPRLAELMLNSGVPDLFIHSRLSDFPTMNLDANKSYLFSGVVGTGKTHMLAALAAECLLQQKKCKFIESAIFFRKCRKDEFNNGNLLDSVMNVDYLFMDDIGVEKLTEWVYDTLYQIIGFRYSHKKHIAVSLNNLKVLDDRLLRRLRDMCEFVVLTEQRQ